MGDCLGVLLLFQHRKPGVDEDLAGIALEAVGFRAVIGDVGIERPPRRGFRYIGKRPVEAFIHARFDFLPMLKALFILVERRVNLAGKEMVEVVRRMDVDEEEVPSLLFHQVARGVGEPLVVHVAELDERIGIEPAHAERAQPQIGRRQPATAAFCKHLSVQALGMRPAVNLAEWGHEEGNRLAVRGEFQ